MHLLALSSLVCLLTFLAPTHASLKHAVEVHDQKEWKKLLKTRTNVLALFANAEDGISDFLPKYDKVAGVIKGKGTMVYVDCQPKDGKKLCKHLKIKPSPFVMKHYKDGSFHKDYDRLLQEKSLLGFMENPAADPPWSEDPTANDVRHVEGPSDFERLLKKEKKPILMMFYAPWCGHCKQLKPEFASAATELKKRAVLAGMDVDTPDAYGIRHEFNISGFPTLIYFEKGRKKYDYAGGRDRESIMEWISNPQPPENLKQSPSEDDQPWSDVESDVVHLTEETFDSFVAVNPSVLVMFYAPWCGHCKAMKPDYMEAASLIKKRDITGVLAAVDATKEAKLGEQYKVEGFPTIKYFKDGAMMYEYGYGRTAEDLVEYMSDPKAPPPPEKEWSEIESEVRHLSIYVAYKHALGPQRLMVQLNAEPEKNSMET